jgi:phosphoadenosine phosphosulfate reductase
MNGHDTIPLFADKAVAARLAEKFSQAKTEDFLCFAITGLFKGSIALVSSFGADSVVLLHMVSLIDKATPVVFVDTRMLFEETLAYCNELTAKLGLTHVQTVPPDQALLAKEDPENFLWASNPDRCCEIRKVLPLASALEGYEAWITGRKRFQAATRAELAFFEIESGRVKFNPLAGWSQAAILDYIKRHDLPSHSLVAQGYPSIGCIPCTSKVRPGEDPRTGRWRGQAKLECGIHTKPLMNETSAADPLKIAIES